MKFGTEILVIELIGIIAFAVSGALVAMKKHFDLFGIIVLGVITAVGGGAVRDLILGINPPAMFQNSLYVFVAFLTSVAAFGFGTLAAIKLKKNRKFFIDIVNFFDAIGLGVFAVTGTNTALINGHEGNAFLAIFVGVVTGIGGGMLRDILAGKIPFVLYKDIYASAAIIGASIYYVMYINKVNSFVSVSSSILVTILIRLLATFYHLGLPKIPAIKIPKK
ncbi:MAG: trimeric intracellular cation channel family protein [Candidatus Gastranaerophilales bacterium]|nr:trimeric intracellular cation channel family protein [Candidatus Gastranaerophilales bacterium]